MEEYLHLRGRKINPNKKMNSCRIDWRKKIVDPKRQGIRVPKREYQR